MVLWSALRGVTLLVLLGALCCEAQNRCTEAYCSFNGVCDTETQNCICDYGYEGTTCVQGPTELPLNSEIKGALTGIGAVHYRLPTFRKNDKVVVSLSAGSAALWGSVGEVPGLDGFQLLGQLKGKTLTLEVTTTKPLADVLSPDDAFYVTLQGLSETVNTEWTVVHDAPWAGFIPGTDMTTSVIVLVTIVLLVAALAYFLYRRQQVAKASEDKQGNFLGAVSGSIAASTAGGASAPGMQAGGGSMMGMQAAGGSMMGGGSMMVQQTSSQQSMHGGYGYDHGYDQGYDQSGRYDQAAYMQQQQQGYGY